MGVIEHDHRRFSAQLEIQTFERGRAVGCDNAADRDAAGVADHLNVGRSHQIGSPVVARFGEDVDNPGR